MTNDEFKEIIDKYERLVFTICFQMVNDYQEAQNLTQDTFLSVYKNFYRFRVEDLKSWVCKIATNKARDYLKSAYYRHTTLDNQVTSLEQTSNTPGAEDMFLHIQEEGEIHKEILKLKEPYLKVCVLFFLEDKSVDEISLELKRPKKTVHTQIQRAKYILKDKLRQGGVGDGRF